MTQQNNIVLIAEKEYAKGVSIFEEAADLDIRPAPCDETDLAAMARETGSRIVTLGVEKYCGPLYDALAANGAGLIVRFGVGHDGVDKALAREKGIIVVNTPGVLDQSVAELTFWLLGAVLRSVSALDKAMKDGDFQAPPGGMELFGRRLLLVGFGGIGRQVARIASRGFGMSVVATGQRDWKTLAKAEGLSPEALLEEYGLESYTTDVTAELPNADVVSIHIASTAQTRHYVDKDFLAAMRNDAVLLNTSRGPVADECALYDALASGQIRGAGLDVFEHEPYKPVNPEKDLRHLDNVVLTPHVGSNTLEANARMASACLANIRHFLEGNLEKLTRVDR